MTDPQPPHSPEAERAVLGAMIVDPSKIEEVRDAGLRQGDFHDGGRAQIYQALLDLDEEGADYITLCDLLKRRGQLDPLGGYSEITALINACVTSAHAVHYANIVRAHATRRRLIQAAALIAEAAYAGKLGCEGLRERAIALIGAASTGNDDVLDMTRPTRPVPPKPKPAPARRPFPEPRLEGVIRDRNAD